MNKYLLLDIRLMAPIEICHFPRAKSSTGPNCCLKAVKMFWINNKGSYLYYKTNKTKYFGILDKVLSMYD